MARIKGAKNKPKSVAELEILLAEARATDKTEGQETSLKTEAIIEQVKQAKTFEIKSPIEENKTDVFHCGQCGERLPSELPQCPHCFSKLNWS